MISFTEDIKSLRKELEEANTYLYTLENFWKIPVIVGACSVYPGFFKGMSEPRQRIHVFSSKCKPPINRMLCKRARICDDFGRYYTYYCDAQDVICKINKVYITAVYATLHAYDDGWGLLVISCMKNEGGYVRLGTITKENHYP